MNANYGSPIRHQSWLSYKQNYVRIMVLDLVPHRLE